MGHDSSVHFAAPHHTSGMTARQTLPMLQVQVQLQGHAWVFPRRPIWRL